MTNDQSYGRTTVAEDDTLKVSKSNLLVTSNIEGVQVLGLRDFWNFVESLWRFKGGDLLIPSPLR